MISQAKEMHDDKLERWLQQRTLGESLEQASDGSWRRVRPKLRSQMETTVVAEETEAQGELRGSMLNSRRLRLLQRRVVGRGEDQERPEEVE